jgi:hypothetical protein
VRFRLTESHLRVLGGTRKRVPNALSTSSVEALNPAVLTVTPDTNRSPRDHCPTRFPVQRDRRRH